MLLTIVGGSQFSLLTISEIGSSSSGSDQYLVRTSYLQIYNERISDLLV